VSSTTPISLAVRGRSESIRLKQDLAWSGELKGREIAKEGLLISPEKKPRMMKKAKFALEDRKKKSMRERKREGSRKMTHRALMMRQMERMSGRKRAESAGPLRAQERECDAGCS